MTADYALPPPDKWAGRGITPEAGRRQESQLTITLG